MKKNQINKDGDPHGYWESYHFNGKLMHKGNYKNGEAHGYFEDYHKGNLIKEFFI